MPVPVSVRSPVDAFEQYVRGGLERAGVPVDPVELDIMRFIDNLYGPELSALAEADLRGIWTEIPLDPGRAPAA